MSAPPSKRGSEIAKNAAMRRATTPATRSTPTAFQGPGAVERSGAVFADIQKAKWTSRRMIPSEINRGPLFLTDFSFFAPRLGRPVRAPRRGRSPSSMLNGRLDRMRPPQPPARFNLTAASRFRDSLMRASFSASRDSSGSTRFTAGRHMAVIAEAYGGERLPTFFPHLAAISPNSNRISS